MLGAEGRYLDIVMSERMDPKSRARIWSSVQDLLAKGPLGEGGDGATGLALGYVQSGKTTSITALIAAGADEGYRIVVALLGGTNLLLGQNRARLETSLGIGTRNDYRWVTEPNPSGATAVKRLANWIDRDRVILVPVLKHAGRINAVASTLARIAEITTIPVLLVDDEADQASLNTSSTSESKTYEAIKALRASVPRHLYVQYTATPYAPLLLDADDLLSPEFVEFLEPGQGYTGGREFFVDFADQVIRDVPLLDEQATKELPLELPKSLLAALGSFVSGASLLLEDNADGAPVSMLVHSTQRNDVQSRYHFLIERQLRKWRTVADAADDVGGLPQELVNERGELVRRGAEQIDDVRFLRMVRWVLREATLWLVNSTSALNRVDWTVAPVHILVGGNKLDRGYTVEGLTVTYMNRPPSTQVDTLEQRARAFGYRRDQLPYCQFFGSKRTVRSLRDIVFTEYDLRARLRDHVDAGGTVHSWAREVGLLLPHGMKPTREAVVRALSASGEGWHSVRLPRLINDALQHNRSLAEGIGVLHASHADYGRLQFRTRNLPLREVLEELVKPWSVDEYGPSWRHLDVVEALERHPDQDAIVPVILMEDDGGPRKRKWAASTGFVNLFQGRDNVGSPALVPYPGDRAIGGIEADPDQVVVQIHRVIRRDEPEPEILTLAVHLGSRKIVRKVDAL